MKALLWNLLLALVWVAATGVFTPTNFLVGIGLGLLVMYVARNVVGSPGYVVKLQQVIRLTAFFIKELIEANLRVAYDVLTPEHHMRPGVIGIPLDAHSDTEITLLSNLITLTPGTLSLDISADRRVLYIHAMYIDDVEEVRRKIKDGFERRILEVMR